MFVWYRYTGRLQLTKHTAWTLFIWKSTDTSDYVIFGTCAIRLKIARQLQKVLDLRGAQVVEQIQRLYERIKSSKRSSPLVGNHKIHCSRRRPILTFVTITKQLHTAWSANYRHDSDVAIFFLMSSYSKWISLQCEEAMRRCWVNAVMVNSVDSSLDFSDWLSFLLNWQSINCDTVCQFPFRALLRAVLLRHVIRLPAVELNKRCVVKYCIALYHCTCTLLYCYTVLCHTVLYTTENGIMTDAPIVGKMKSCLRSNIMRSFLHQLPTVNGRIASHVWRSYLLPIIV